MGTQYTFLYPKLFTAPSRVESPPFLQSPCSAGAPSFLPFLLAIGTQAAAAALRIELCYCVSGFPSGLRPPASHHAPSPPVLCTPAGDPACLPFSLLPPPVHRQRLVICRLLLLAKARCLVWLCILVFLVIGILVSLQSIFDLLSLVISFLIIFFYRKETQKVESKMLLLRRPKRTSL
jgi:hypothetical protein